MPDIARIREALTTVMDPELGRNLIELGMVKDIKIDGGKVSFTVNLTVPTCPLSGQIEADAKAAVAQIPGVEEVEVTLGAMSDEDRARAFGGGGAGGAGGAGAEGTPNVSIGVPEAGPTQAQQLSHVGAVVAVMSGKGGVGKSLVTGMLATALARQGRKVGILDADITGPSIPKMFGLGPGVDGGEFGIMPPASGLGTRIMSINLLVDQEDAPVIWRGPLIAGAIKQFWTDVVWGDLDVLLVDLPPGTSDAPLTVMQSLPLTGVVVVSTPQDLAGMVVRKAVKMATQMNVPILGVVENMSYFVAPDTGKRYELFGPSRGEELAKAADAPLLARLPIDPRLASLCDAGRIEDYKSGEAEAMAKAVAERVGATASKE